MCTRVLYRPGRECCVGMMCDALTVRIRTLVCQQYAFGRPSSLSVNLTWLHPGTKNIFHEGPKRRGPCWDRYSADRWPGPRVAERLVSGIAGAPNFGALSDLQNRGWLKPWALVCWHLAKKGISANRTNDRTTEQPPRYSCAKLVQQDCYNQPLYTDLRPLPPHLTPT